MEALKKFAIYIQSLDRKQLQKFTGIVLGSITLVAGIMTYTIQQKRSDLISKITQLNTLTHKATKIIQENKKMADEEFRLKEILDKNKDFTIKGFFEQFCRSLSLTPEAGWDTRTETLNEQFDEITLSSSFKEQTTESIVKILQELDKNNMVYLKELSIKKDDQAKLTLYVTLAAKRYKSLLE